MTTDKPSAGELADRLESRAAAHDKMCMGATMGLGYFSGNDARLMRDAATALRSPVAGAEVGVSQGLMEAIAAKRRRQIAKGYDAAHDDKHTKGEIALGAAAYCVSSVKYEGNGKSSYSTVPQWAPPEWPWSREEFHPSGDPRSDLLDAAAMILAEIERLDRIAPLALPVAERDALCSKLRAMPSSLNDALRTMEEAAEFIERDGGAAQGRLDPGLAKAMEIVGNMRQSEAGLFDAKHSGQRGCDRLDALYDAYVAIRAAVTSTVRGGK